MSIASSVNQYRHSRAGGNLVTSNFQTSTALDPRLRGDDVKYFVLGRG